MDFREFVDRCGGIVGQRGQDSVVRCPLCQGETESSAHGYVRDDGKGGILFHCMKQSDAHKLPDVLAYWGVTGNRDAASKRASKPAPKASKPAQKADTPKAEGERKRLGREDAVYQYLNEDGTYAFEVVRYDPKDFRQRTRNADGGYTFSVKSEIRNSLIFRLPEIRQAIDKRQTVYVAEGEKDVLRLAANGYAATCIAGGASKPWTDDQLLWLRYANVVVIPDNDPMSDIGIHKGQEYAYKLAEALTDYAASVKLIDLTRSWAKLPEKGDISDWFDHFGDAAGREMLDALVDDTAEFAVGYPKFWLDERGRAADEIAKVGGYGVEDGCIGEIKRLDANGNPQMDRLADFVAIPFKQVTLDDGMQTRSEIHVKGWTQNGKPLKVAVVPQSEYESMGWIGKNWGIDAQVLPGNAKKDKLRYAVAAAGRRTAERVTKYVHTGWREVDGKWCYLYNGGAIGKTDCACELLGNLKRYDLSGTDEYGQDDLLVACAESYGLKDVMSDRLYYPVMAAVYMAPLVEFLRQADMAPGYMLFLHGQSGVHKSTTEALALSHFGKFTTRSLPANFESTINSIREMCFFAKDVLIAIDDFHPSGDPHKRKMMDEVFQSLLRSYGDLSDRLRMNADLTLRPTRPARGVAIVSGEDYPEVGESGLARMYAIELTKADLTGLDNGKLTDVQMRASRGALIRAMRGYIEYLSERTGILPRQLEDRFYKLRQEARERLKKYGAHDRFAEMIAMMMLALEIMWDYFKSVDLLDDAEIVAESEHAWCVFCIGVGGASDRVKEEAVSSVFIRVLTEQIASGSVWFDPGNGAKAPSANVPKIGYADDKYYYLLSDVAYNSVFTVLRARNQEMKKTVRGLSKELIDKGIVTIYEAGRTTKKKRFGSQTLQVMWIERKVLDGEPIVENQESMEFERLPAGERDPFEDIDKGRK